MKVARIALSVLILLGVFMAVGAIADEGGTDEPKCDCWYWSSNQKGTIETVKLPDGTSTEDCVVKSCKQAE